MSTYRVAPSIVVVRPDGRMPFQPQEHVLVVGTAARAPLRYRVSGEGWGPFSLQFWQHTGTELGGDARHGTRRQRTGAVPQGWRCRDNGGMGGACLARVPPAVPSPYESPGLQWGRSTATATAEVHLIPTPRCPPNILVGMEGAHHPVREGRTLRRRSRIPPWRMGARLRCCLRNPRRIPQYNKGRPRWSSLMTVTMLFAYLDPT